MAWFNVTGRDRGTGKEVSQLIEANTAEEAAARANFDVDDVQPTQPPVQRPQVSPVHPPPIQPPPPATPVYPQPMMPPPMPPQAPHYMPQQQVVNVYAQQTNGLGTFAFIMALLGLFTCPLFTVIGFFSGLIALGKEPRGLAIAAVILTIIEFVIYLLIIIFFGAAILASASSA
ncbi:MAG: hypothetical protein AAGC44_02865 [Planctomycetota bacterium]